VIEGRKKRTEQTGKAKTQILNGKISRHEQTGEWSSVYAAHNHRVEGEGCWEVGGGMFACSGDSTLYPAIHPELDHFIIPLLMFDDIPWPM